jgi:hypothetical protein
MIVVGIDPGVTTGLAAWDIPTQSVLFFAEGTNPTEIFKQASASRIERFGKDHTYVIENFIGGGHRTAEANHTLQALGYFRYALMGIGCTVVLQVPQWRKAYVSRAAELLLPDYPDAHHSIDALAHCLCFEARQR